MFCPMCGTESQNPNAYCKRCGEWLPDIKTRTPARSVERRRNRNIFTGLFMSALSTLAALFSAIALYATYLGAGDAKWSVYVARRFLSLHRRVADVEFCRYSQVTADTQESS
jgi:hypothetical protein